MGNWLGFINRTVGKQSCAEHLAPVPAYHFNVLGLLGTLLWVMQPVWDEAMFYKNLAGIGEYTSHTNCKEHSVQPHS